MYNFPMTTLLEELIADVSALPEDQQSRLHVRCWCCSTPVPSNPEVEIVRGRR
jgi:hypothetical protein